MMINSHIAQQHSAALERESLAVAARARVVADVDARRFADRVRSVIAHPFPRGRMVAARQCS
jgi:hypothetical protein